MPTANKGTILIVNDHEENLKNLSSILTKNGYIVHPVISAQLALKAVSQCQPDLILLDILMPDMGGYEVCECLKANEESRDIPVIFISVVEDISAKVKAFQMGCVDYMTKPFREEEILVRIELHLKLRQMELSLKAANAQLQQKITEQKRITEQLIQSKKMAAIGTLAGGIAHEFNNIIGIITGNISYALSQINENEELFEVLSDVQDGANQAKKLTQRLITFAEGDTPIKTTKFDFKKSGKILVMDDQEAILKLTGRLLNYMGYEAAFAKDGEQVIKIYQEALKSGNPFDVVILDLTIPEKMGGIETIKELLKIDPKVKALVSSGYSIDPVMANFQDYGFCGALPKPYTKKQLSETLNQILK
ncbi:MAG: response regulator [Desulfobacterales bacterium]|nr:response regulator [Desulfobacterales bacterium]